jgi:hypothetical protein
MSLQVIVFVISDMSAKMSADNVEIINNLTELNFEDTDNVTYQMLIDARRESIGSGYGYPMFKDGLQFWVLPSLQMGLTVDPNSTVIKQYTEEEYVRDVLPTFDVENIEDI